MIRFASRIGPTCSGENSRSNGSAIRQRYTICDPWGVVYAFAPCLARSGSACRRGLDGRPPLGVLPARAGSLPRLRRAGPAGRGRRRGRGPRRAWPPASATSASTTDWREVLAHPAVDAVASPRRTSCTATWPSPPRGGQAPLAEKPLGRSLAETREISDAVERAGVRRPSASTTATRRPSARRALIAERRARRAVTTSACSSSPATRRAPRARCRGASCATTPARGARRPRLARLDLAQFLLGPIARVTAASAIHVPRRPVPAAGGTHFAWSTRAPSSATSRTRTGPRRWSSSSAACAARWS